jgi:hypothetical protein
MYQLEIIKPWRYRDRARGSQTLVPGLYDVPSQVSAALAARAVAEGMGHPRERIQQVPLAEQSPVLAGLPKRKRGRPRKYPATNDRSLGVAPENKS